MTESEFNQLSDSLFHLIEQMLESADGDIDFELAAGNVLEIECSNSKIIINRQPAMHEIWIAARSGGFHYRWQEGAWHNTRDHRELLQSLADMLNQQCQVTISLPDTHP